MKMPFGKYRGEDVADVPEDYLAWVIENCELRSEAIADAIEARLAGTYQRGARRHERAASPPPPPRPPGAGTTAGGAAGGELALLEKVVRAWHRQMTLKYHPDRGGTHEQMVVVNEGAEPLKRLAGVN